MPFSGQGEVDAPVAGPGEHPVSRVGMRRAVVLGAIATAVGIGRIWMIRSVFLFLDLDVYRIAVRAWMGGKDLYGVLSATRSGQSLPFLYPPFAALTLSPMALLPWTICWFTFVVLSLLALTAVVYLTTRRLWPAQERRRAIVLTAVAVPLTLQPEPVWETLRFGQINLLLMALVALDCLAEKPRWPRGALVGLAAAIKLTPAAFALFFLLRKDYRATLTTTTTFLAAGLLGFVVAPGSSREYWPGSSPGLRGMAGSPYASNQSILGALARLHQLPSEARTVLWLILAVGVLALAVLGMLRALRADDPALAMAINGGLALLVSPISWGHHWVDAVPAVLAMTAHAIRSGDKRWAGVAVLTTAVFVVAPFQFVPMGGYRELAWTWWEHLVGNPYVLLTVILLATMGRA